MEDKQLISREQSNQAIAPAYYEDEISLVDLWLVLVKHKRTIWITAAAVILIVGVYLVFTKPVYESVAVIEVGQLGQLGQVGQVGQVENPEVLVRRLKEEYRVDDDSEGRVELPRLESVSHKKRGAKSLLTLKARGYSSKDAKEYLVQVTQKLKEEHEVLLNSAVKVQKKLINTLSKRVGNLDTEIKSLDSHISRIKDKNPAQAAILAIEKSKVAIEIPKYEQDLAMMEIALSPVKTRPTRLIRKPTLPVKPSKPKYVLFAVLSLFVGLIAGVFLAFFVEFLQMTRAAHKEMLNKQEEPKRGA